VSPNIPYHGLYHPERLLPTRVPPHNKFQSSYNVPHSKEQEQQNINKKDDNNGSGNEGNSKDNNNDNNDEEIVVNNNNNNNNISNGKKNNLKEVNVIDCCDGDESKPQMEKENVKKNKWETLNVNKIKEKDGNNNNSANKNNSNIKNKKNELICNNNLKIKESLLHNNVNKIKNKKNELNNNNIVENKKPVLFSLEKLDKNYDGKERKSEGDAKYKLIVLVEEKNVMGKMLNEEEILQL
jgi:hypothetical protein